MMLIDAKGINDMSESKKREKRGDDFHVASICGSKAGVESESRGSGTCPVLAIRVFVVSFYICHLSD